LTTNGLLVNVAPVDVKISMAKEYQGKYHSLQMYGKIIFFKNQHLLLQIPYNKNILNVDHFHKMSILNGRNDSHFHKMSIMIITQ